MVLTYIPSFRVYPSVLATIGADDQSSMKTGIHPEYHQIKVSCACGNTFEVGSTRTDDLRVEICANCHPLYTGKSKLIDTTGRVDRFQARVQKAQVMKGETITLTSKQEAAAAEAAEAPTQAAE